MSQLLHTTDPPPALDPRRAPSPRLPARLGPIGVAALFVFGKLKWLLAGFKMMNLGTLLTMVLTVGVYTTMWGFKFALGFVLLLFVHELGHAIAMRRLGIPAGAPVFIPFVGAVIAMRGMPRNAWVEAVVGIGGPLLGTLGATACLAVGLATGQLVWVALASTGFMLNLFNLIPVSPLDGGRIVGVVTRWLWVVGYAIGITVFLVTYSPILGVILLLGVFQLGKTWKSGASNAAYYDVPARKRITMAAAYFGLVGFLALGMWFADHSLAVLHDGERLLTLTSGATLLFGLGKLLTTRRPQPRESPGSLA